MEKQKPLQTRERSKTITDITMNSLGELYNPLKYFFQDIMENYEEPVIVIMSRKSYALFTIFNNIYNYEHDKLIITDRGLFLNKDKIKDKLKSDGNILVIDDHIGRGSTMEKFCGALKEVCGLNKSRISIRVFSRQDDIESSQIDQYRISNQVYVDLQQSRKWMNLYADAILATSTAYISYVPSYRINYKKVEEILKKKSCIEITNKDLNSNQVVPTYILSEDSKILRSNNIYYSGTRFYKNKTLNEVTVIPLVILKSMKFSSLHMIYEKLNEILELRLPQINDSAMSKTAMEFAYNSIYRFITYILCHYTFIDFAKENGITDEDMKPNKNIIEHSFGLKYSYFRTSFDDLREEVEEIIVRNMEQNQIHESENTYQINNLNDDNELTEILQILDKNGYSKGNISNRMSILLSECGVKDNERLKRLKGFPLELIVNKIKKNTKDVEINDIMARVVEILDIGKASLVTDNNEDESICTYLQTGEMNYIFISKYHPGLIQAYYNLQTRIKRLSEEDRELVENKFIDMSMDYCKSLEQLRDDTVVMDRFFQILRKSQAKNYLIDSYDNILTENVDGTSYFLKLSTKLIYYVKNYFKEENSTPFDTYIHEFNFTEKKELQNAEYC